MRTLLIIASLMVSFSSIAVPGNNNSVSPCDLTDVGDIIVMPSANGGTIACFGGVSGNNSDALYDDLSNAPIWSQDGLLTESGGQVTDGWLEYGKKEFGASNGLWSPSTDATSPFRDSSDPFTFSNCDGDGSVECGGQWESANFMLNIENPVDPNVFYNQLVLSVKAGSAYALYQIEINPGVSIPFSLTGMIQTFNNKEISNLSVWLRQTAPSIDVSAPPVIAFLLLGLVLMFVRSKK